MIKWTWIDSGWISLLLKKAFELTCELIVGPSNPFMTFRFLLTSFKFWWAKGEKEQRNPCMFPENTRWTGSVLVCLREETGTHFALYKKNSTETKHLWGHTQHTHTFRLSLILYSSLSRLRLTELWRLPSLVCMDTFKWIILNLIYNIYEGIFKVSTSDFWCAWFPSVIWIK